MVMLFSFMDFVTGSLWVLLFISMIVLMAVILLQEGKGGGLAEAFGGAGAETFGVKAHGINKFTALIATVFLALCVTLTWLSGRPDETPIAPGLLPKTSSFGQPQDPMNPAAPGFPDAPVRTPPVNPPSDPPSDDGN